MKTLVIFIQTVIICSLLSCGCIETKKTAATQVHYYYWPCNSFSQTWIPDSSNTYSVKDLLELKIDEDAYLACQTCDGLIEVTFRHPWQDNIIEILSEGGIVKKGMMWTSSDEIDPGRENYNSGQCVVPMNVIRQVDDTLFFTIDYSNVTFFSNAIDVNIHSSEEAIASGYKKWINSHNIRRNDDSNNQTIYYYAIIESDSLLLFRKWGRSNEWSERTFKQIDKQKLETIPRKMPEIMERSNTIDDSN